MNQTLGPDTDNPQRPHGRPPARVAITGSGGPRRLLSIALGISTIVLTVVGVFAVLALDGPRQGGTRPSSSSSTPTMRQCWDGSGSMSDHDCPPLTGKQALTEWLVTSEVPFDSCTLWTEETAVDEVEVYDCLWYGGGVDVFISRWDSPFAAQRYFADEGRSVREEPPWGGRKASAWRNDTADHPYYAVLYLTPDLTYSVNVVAQTTDLRDEAVARLNFREPAELAQQKAER